MTVAELMRAYGQGERLFRDVDLTDAKFPSDVPVNLSNIILRDAKIAGAEMNGVNLGGAILSGADFQGAKLNGANLQAANLQGANLTGASLEGADLGSANLCEAVLVGATLTMAKLVGANLERASASEADFQHADLSGARAKGADMRSATLSSAILNKADLSDAVLQEADLWGAEMEEIKGHKINLSEASLVGAKLSGAKLYEANFTKALLQESDLGMADLSNADLSDVAMCMANLDKADFSEANLARADLGGSSAREANFDKADLSDAGLIGVDASGSSFRETKLVATELSEAILERTDFRGASLVRTALYRADLSGSILRDIVDPRSLRSPGEGATKPARLRRFGRWLKSGLIRLAPRRERSFSMRLDNTRIWQCQFSKNDSDPWSILRSGYTGPKFALHLLVLCLFFAPLAGRAVFWSAAANVEEVALTELESRLAGLSRTAASSSDHSAVRWAEHAMLELEKPMSLELRRDRAELLLADLGETKPMQRPYEVDEEWVFYEALPLLQAAPLTRRETDSHRLFLVLLGYDIGWGTFVMSILFLTYNLARAYLTYAVGPLREAEERSGWSPSWSDYKNLYKAHMLFSILLFFAVVSGTISILDTLLATVIVPS